MLFSSNSPIILIQIVFLMIDDFVDILLNLVHAVTESGAIEDFTFDAVGDLNQATRGFLGDDLVFVFHG